jgi:hypothetical protein
MESREKVELFDQIRREYESGVGIIKGVAEKQRVHRRIVRQALAGAQSPERKPGELIGSKPLLAWRKRGQWPESYDRLLAELIGR